MSPSAWFGRLRSYLPKLLRSGAVSIVSTMTTLTVLGLAVGVANAPAGWANVAATTVGTVPSFELNRRWVWSKQGRRSALREVAPFAGLSLTGLVASTFAVHTVATWAHLWGWSRLARTAAVGTTNAGTFGTLWLCQFVLCDRVLFRPAVTHPRPPLPHGPRGRAEEDPEVLLS